MTLLRFRCVCVALLFAVGAALVPAAPVPVQRPRWDPIEVGGLRLTFTPVGKTVFSEKKGEHGIYALLTLTNRTDKEQVSEVLGTSGLPRQPCRYLSFIVWFPDGTVEQGTGASVCWPGGHEEDIPCRLAPGGSTQVQLSLSGPVRRAGRIFRLRKHDWKFCLTAVSEKYGLQSKTVSYNGCPMPPPSYRPLDHTENGPVTRARREAERQEALRKAAELRKKYGDVPIDPTTGEPGGRLEDNEHVPDGKARPARKK